MEDMHAYMDNSDRNDYRRNDHRRDNRGGGRRRDRKPRDRMRRDRAVCLISYKQSFRFYESLLKSHIKSFMLTLSSKIVLAQGISKWVIIYSKDTMVTSLNVIEQFYNLF